MSGQSPVFEFSCTRRFSAFLINSFISGEKGLLVGLKIKRDSFS